MGEQALERVFAPAYLWNFVCDGTACGSRCCGGWRIPVDAAARARLEKLPERENIFARLERKGAGWMTRHGESGNCAFLDEGGLCLLQKRHGEMYLPDICDSYPRVSYRFEGFVERTLALSCPVAARLALRPKEPMRFGERTVPARRASSAVRPPMEALRWERALRAFQIRAIAFLQDRRFSLRERFWRLGHFFTAVEAAGGKTPPEEELLGRCAAEAAADADMTPRTDPLPRLRYMASLLSELYEAGYPPERVAALAARVAEIEAEAERVLHGRSGHILENLAVNEFFLRLYPFACGGGFLANFKLFALRFRVAEFSLLLAAAAKAEVPDEARILTMLDRVMERLDHSHVSDGYLRRRVSEDFDGMTNDAFLAML